MLDQCRFAEEFSQGDVIVLSKVSKQQRAGTKLRKITERKHEKTENHRNNTFLNGDLMTYKSSDELLIS